MSVIVPLIKANVNGTPRAPTPPVNLVAPVISGTARTSFTLSCTTGSWIGADSFTYQWRANGVDIGGATNSTYQLTTSEDADAITCYVTATNGLGSTGALSNSLTSERAVWWVGGAATWDATAGSKWAASPGGTGGVAVPDLNTHVYVDALSTGTLATASGTVCTCKDLIFTGYTGTFNHIASSTVSIYGSLTLSASMTYTIGNNSSSVLWLRSTTLVQLIDTAGKTVPVLTSEGVGGIRKLASNYTSTGTQVSIVSGTFDTDGYDMSLTSGGFQSTSTNVRAVYFRDSVITMSAAGTMVNFQNANLTFDAGTSQFTGTTTSGSYSLNLTDGMSMYDVTVQAGTSLSIGGTGTLSFRNLTVNTHSTNSSSALSVSTGATLNVTGTLTLNGFSERYRLFVGPSNIFTNATYTITAANVVGQYVDFRSVVSTNTIDTTGWTGFAGDGGNTSGITFVAAITAYRVGASTSWTAANAWATSSGGTGGSARQPLIHDTVVWDSNGAASVSMDNLHVGGIDFSSAQAAFTLNWGGNNLAVYGSLILKSGGSITGGGDLFFSGVGTMTFTTNGVTLASGMNVQIRTHGTLVLGSDLVTATNSNVAVNGGTFDTAGYNVTTRDFNISSGTQLYLRSSTITLVGTGSVWFTNAGSINIDYGTSLLDITDTSASAKSFTLQSAGDRQFYSLRVRGAASAGTFTFGATCTFNGTVTFDPLSNIRFTAGQTYTVNGTMTAAGTSGNLVTIQSTSSTNATISKSTGSMTWTYATMADLTATGGATFSATNSSGTDCPGWTITP